MTPAAAASSSVPATPSVAARLVRAARAVRWLMRGVVGADAYERYLAHHHRTHGELPPMTEREFWRDRTDAMERNPKSRCC